MRERMGWYFRKSLGLGPLRLNLSKSGIGYSVGVRGARIGVGPRGNYVRLGRGGIYYQKYFSTSPATHSSRISPRVDATVDGTPIITAAASELRDETSAGLLGEIREKHRKIRLAPIFAVISGLVLLGLLSVNVNALIVLAFAAMFVLAHVALARRDWEQKLVIVNYDLDTSARLRYVQLLKALQSFSGSGRIWRVSSLREGVDRKYHAGASTLLERKAISLQLSVPYGFQTPLAIWSMRLGKQTLYFFPDRILVFEGPEVGAVSYDSVSVVLGQTRFVEENGVPADAQIVDSTWRYVNKNGTPDRRFNNNRELPVVLYSQIRISSPAGLNIALESSNLNKAAAFSGGLELYISSGRQLA